MPVHPIFKTYSFLEAGVDPTVWLGGSNIILKKICKIKMSSSWKFSKINRYINIFYRPIFSTLGLFYNVFVVLVETIAPAASLVNPVFDSGYEKHTLKFIVVNLNLWDNRKKFAKIWIFTNYFIQIIFNDH